jgi:hypothetical protein
MDGDTQPSFHRDRCLLIPRWMQQQRVEQIRRTLRDEVWVRDEHTSANFHFDRLIDETLDEQLNEEMMALSETVSSLLDGQFVSRFGGRLKRLRRGPDYRFPWHSDRSGGRLMGLSLCLQAVDGGDFEVRSKGATILHHRLSGLQPGDVHLFDVQDETLVHRISRVRCDGSRIFFAGWFF